MNSVDKLQNLGETNVLANLKIRHVFVASFAAFISSFFSDYFFASGLAFILTLGGIIFHKYLFKKNYWKNKLTKKNRYKWQ